MQLLDHIDLLQGSNSVIVLVTSSSEVNLPRCRYPLVHSDTDTQSHTVQENYITKTKRTTTKLQNLKLRKRERGKSVTIYVILLLDCIPTTC